MMRRYNVFLPAERKRRSRRRRRIEFYLRRITQFESFRVPILLWNGTAFQRSQRFQTITKEAWNTWRQISRFIRFILSDVLELIKHSTITKLEKWKIEAER